MAFEADVKTVVEKEIKDLDKLHLEVSKHSLRGVSGNRWTLDMIIKDTTENVHERSIKAIIECKGPGYDTGVKPEPQTYREHMLRAYAELGDLRNWNVPKFLVFPYIEETRVFDYKAYFESIGVEIVDWEHFYSPENRLLAIIGEL